MTRRVCLLITISLLALTACEKSMVAGKGLSAGLAGRWNYSQSYYSIGGPLMYVSTENLHQWIDFGTGGNFTTNIPQFQGFTSYEVLDSAKIKLIRRALSSERFFVHIDAPIRTLTISSADNICIEGCGNKFKR